MGEKSRQDQTDALEESRGLWTGEKKRVVWWGYWSLKLEGKGLVERGMLEMVFLEVEQSQMMTMSRERHRSGWLRWSEEEGQ